MASSFSHERIFKMNNKSEIDLNKIRLREELRYVESEINRLNSEIADLANQIRWKQIRKQDILSELGEYNF